MNLEDLAILSDAVLNMYLTKCIHCSGLLFCEIIDKIMNKTMRMIEEHINNDFDEDLELILGET